MASHRRSSKRQSVVCEKFVTMTVHRQAQASRHVDESPQMFLARDFRLGVTKIRT
jgi:hypothetical protein